MALRTLGTNSSSILQAIFAASASSASNTEVIPGNFANFSAQDLGTFNSLVKDDKINTRPIYPYALTNTGLLTIPNRGTLRVLPGDWIGVDATGWPILVGARAISPFGGGPTTSWTHS